MARVTIPNPKSDFETYRANPRRPSETETLKALQHRDASVRAQAVKNIGEFDLSIESKELILAAKLKDKSGQVRIAALRSISALRLKSLADSVAHFLSVAKNEGEISGAIESLGRMGNENSVPLLIDYLVGPFDYFQNKAADALIKLGHPSTIDLVNIQLVDKRKWLDTANVRLNDSYASICEVAIHFQSKKSIPLLKEVFTKRNKLVQQRILEDLLRREKRKTETKNPFVIAFDPECKFLLKSPSHRIRRAAFELTCMINSNENFTRKIIGEFLNDKEDHIKGDAAEWAAIYKFTDYRNIIQRKYEKAAGSLKINLCCALKELGGDCNEDCSNR